MPTNQRIFDKLKKIKTGLSIHDFWPWKPYKGNLVGWVIDTYPKYVEWSLDKGIELDNEAYTLLQDCLEI